MILLIGQCAREHLDREAFQEIDYRRMFGQMAKWVAQIDDPKRIPEYLSHAFHTATSGRPGPVVLSLPEDVLSDACDAWRRARNISAWRRRRRAAQIERVACVAGKRAAAYGDRGRQRLDARKRARTCDASSKTGSCRSASHSAFRTRSTTSIRTTRASRPRYRSGAGCSAFAMPTCCLHRAAPRRSDDQRLHAVRHPEDEADARPVHQGAEELGRVYAADLPIVSGMPELAALLAELKPSSTPRWAGSREAAHRAYLDWRKPRPIPGDVQMGEVIQQLRAHLPDDAILTNGAGNYATWLHRHFSYRHFRSQLAPTSGAMGYGVPAAIAAKIDVSASRGRRAGRRRLLHDGRARNSRQRCSTTCACMFIVVNNSHFGTIRMHQERHYPDRVHGTGLTNPDFAAFARSFGAHGETWSDRGFPACAQRAHGGEAPALIEIRMPQEASTPGATLEQIREQGRKMRGEASRRVATSLGALLPRHTLTQASMHKRALRE